MPRELLVAVYKMENKRIICACGCQTEFDYLDKHNRPRKFIHGHNSNLNEFKQMMKRIHSERPSWNKGRKETREEVLKKQSESHKGLLVWNKGKKGLQEGWNKGLTKETNESVMMSSEKRIGRKISEETRIKIKDKRKYQKHNYTTSIETKIQNYLKELNLDFFTHQYINIEHGYQCDILVPYLNLVIECDGNYWHSYPIGRDMDHIRTKELIEKGFKVLRLWEFEINQMSLNKFKERLNEV